MEEKEFDINNFNLEEESTNKKVIYPPTEKQEVKYAPRSYLKEVRLDNTKRSVAEQCLRKFFLAHVIGLKSAYGSTPLRYGSTWHAFLEGYYETVKEKGWGCRSDAINAGILLGKKKWDTLTERQIFIDDYRTFDNGVSSFLQYITHFEGDQLTLKVIATEQVYILPIVLSDEEKKLFPDLPPVVFTGKIDLQVNLDSLNWINEFKSTGQSLSIQSNRLYRSNQVIGYTYAGIHALNFNPAGALVTLHQLTSRKGKDGNYGKATIDFARPPQIFTEDDLIKWKISFLTTCMRIHIAELTNNFPCQFDSCFDFNRKCQFYGLCTSETDPKHYADEIPEGYIQEFWDVEEESEE